jgi:hypothetical protein
MYRLSDGIGNHLSQRESNSSHALTASDSGKTTRDVATE